MPGVTEAMESTSLWTARAPTKLLCTDPTCVGSEEAGFPARLPISVVIFILHLLLFLLHILDCYLPFVEAIVRVMDDTRPFIGFGLESIIEQDRQPGLD